MNRAVLPPLVAGLLVGLAACAPLRTEPEGAAAQTYLTTTATVLAVDPAARSLSLRDASDGSTFTVTADAEAGDLRRIAPGDVIMLDYFASTALEMAPPGAAVAPLAVAGDAPTPVGSGPGGVAVESVSAVVELVAYDAGAGTATVRTPDGTDRRLTVPPQLAGFVAGLAPGDRVLVTLTEAVALSVTPAEE